MNARTALFLTALGWTLALGAADASGPSLEFSRFNIIAEENIFNGTRTHRARAGEEVKEVRVDTLTLVGTLTYEKGPYAFFDGSSPDFRGSVEAGKTIGGFTVAQIQGDLVKLSAGTNTFDLEVGMQLRREENGEWKLAGGGSGSSAKAGAATSSAPSDDTDIVKRLIKQREQELQ